MGIVISHSGFFLERVSRSENIKEMKIGELDELLELEELVSGYFLLEQDEERRKLLEENYLYILFLGLDIHVGISESWNQDSESFEEDFDYYHFRHSDTKESIYTEQGSSLITCIHNFTGLSWEEIEGQACEVIQTDRDIQVEEQTLIYQ